MPGTVASEPPTVSLSFANNFWGKEDAGVNPLLERMHGAKVTADELKSFYYTRASIEDDYARKLLALARKPLGSSEAGTLRMSLDVVRGEVESMGKAHQNISNQMRTELDEQLAAHAGGMKERRKIVQTGIEKLHKVKTQQTNAVTKARDRYEQDCLKIKGYLAQGHMVMGQEERKNKAKLEKTQIQLSSSSNEYQSAVKGLEETTGRWNRDWKAACDKFQDLEEERLDFMKNSLWSFANIASTVCVSDDAVSTRTFSAAILALTLLPSCEKIRLSLEDCDVSKDISTFIKESGTGQDIPDPPKFIDFCRSDLNDARSEGLTEENYSVAQFQRTINPAFRSSSPQLTGSNGPSSEADAPFHHEIGFSDGNDSDATPRKGVQDQSDRRDLDSSAHNIAPPRGQLKEREEIPEVPHNAYPTDGMTQFCRLGPPSDRSSVASPYRPSSRESQSEYSDPTSFSSQEPSNISYSSTKQGTEHGFAPIYNEDNQKKKSGFFQSRSPFRRKSKSTRERQSEESGKSKRNTWAASVTQETARHYGQTPRATPYVRDALSKSPEPADPRAQFQLNVGSNIFDVASPDSDPKPTQAAPNTDEKDPIAQALAELKGVSKQASVRMSADRYHGLSTPDPASDTMKAGLGSSSGARLKPSHVPDRTAPPAYNPAPPDHLGAPQPAFTSRSMQQTTQKYVDQKRNMFNPVTRHRSAEPIAQGQSQHYRSPLETGGARGPGLVSSTRATSPVPFRSISPRPGFHHQSPAGRHVPRAASPNPYLSGSQMAGNRPQAHSSSRSKARDEFQGPMDPGDEGYEYDMPGVSSSQPPRGERRNGIERPSSRGDMALELAPSTVPSRNSNGPPSQQLGDPRSQRTQSQQREPRQHGGMQSSGIGGRTGHYGVAPSGALMPDYRGRSRSVADGRQYSRDGRPILHHARAIYMYQAAIPEELSFGKNEVLAVLRMQDDGWWEAEVVGKRNPPGLVPSNYLVQC